MKNKKILSFSLLSLMMLASCGGSSCPTSCESLNPIPSISGGLEGNASNDKVEHVSVEHLYEVLYKASRVKKYSYEITSNVRGSEGHFINYITPYAWYEENDVVEESFGLAQTYDKKEVFKYYLDEENNIIPSTYEYTGGYESMDKLSPLYSQLTLTHISLLQDTLDTFEAIYASSNRFLITDSDTASVFQYMTTFGFSITNYIVGVYVEILDEENLVFKAICDLGDYGDIECVFTDLTKTGSKIDHVNEKIINEGLKGIEYHEDVNTLFVDLMAKNNYVLEGIYLNSSDGALTTPSYTINCTNDYFFLDYANENYSDFGFVLVPKNVEVTYLKDNQEVSQTLSYDACYGFSKDKNGNLYFDSFIGPIESNMKYVEVDALPSKEEASTDILYIVKDENGAGTVYEYVESTDGVYEFKKYQSWYETVGDFYINEISASFYPSSCGITDIGHYYYEKDLNNENTYYTEDVSVLSSLANGLFGWGFQSGTDWISYVQDSYIRINKDNDVITDADITLNILASVNGSEYKKQEIYYNINSFGKGNLDFVDDFLYEELGGVINV